LTQTIETLRTIRLHIDQGCIVNNIRFKLDGNYETTLEFDSHANTCVLGCGALIILDYIRPVSIVGYDESLGYKTYQTVSGVVVTPHMVTNSFQERAVPICKILKFPNGDPHLVTGIPVW
jgi:hypothetical protein